MNFTQKYPCLLLLLLGFFVFNQPVFAQQKKTKYKMGLRLDDQKYMKLRKKPTSIRFKGTLPPMVNLKEYTPTIDNQEPYQNCVAWSTAYYMRTMMEARKQKLSGNQKGIDAVRFSPTYIYEKIKESDDNDCQGGSFPADALDVMKKDGNILLSRLPIECDVDVKKYDSEAAKYRIEGYSTLVDNTATSTGDKVLRLKEALAQTENPVPIAIGVPNSFVGAVEQWKPSPGESLSKKETLLGYHAITIVGYDDEKFGGSFQIVNSWGKDWGDKGFTWVNYNDLVRFMVYAFEVYSDAKPSPSPSPVVALQSSMEFTVKNGEKMPVYSVEEKGLDTKEDSRVEMITYKMTKPYVSGTSFKMSVSNNKQSYMYIIGSDDASRTTKLFPYGGTNENVNPIVPEKSLVVLPAANRSFVMDTQVGNDYFLVLVSDKELNFEDLVSKIKSASGDFKEKVYTALSKELIAPEHIRYKPNEVSFEVTGNPAGSIVPLLVMIEHK